MDQPPIPEDGTRDSTRREHTVRFILAVGKTYSSQGTVLRVISENEGVPNAEVILIVETWLDQMKNRFKDNLGKAMHFDGSFGL